MAKTTRSICWTPLWTKRRAGLEHLRLSTGQAASTLCVVPDDAAPFTLTYAMRWDTAWRLQEAAFSAVSQDLERSLVLRTDGRGAWRDGDDRHLPSLDGCLDIDVWPSPFSNTFPIRRQRLAVGERREFCMAWVCAPKLTVKPMRQAYTRVADRTYLYESLDGSAFKARITVDRSGLVLRYPTLFVRVPMPD